MENKEIEIKAKEIRKDIINEVYSASSGHPGGSLSIADVMAVLYFTLPAILNYPENSIDNNFQLETYFFITLKRTVKSFFTVLFTSPKLLTC